MTKSKEAAPSTNTKQTQQTQQSTDNKPTAGTGTGTAAQTPQQSAGTGTGTAAQTPQQSAGTGTGTAAQTPQQSAGTGTGTAAQAPQQEDCTGFSGAYDFNRFNAQTDDKIRLHELKCAQARGDDLKAVNSHGTNLLHSAAQHGDLDSVKFLIETIKMDINLAIGRFQYTALIYAAQHGHLNVVKYLVGKGVKVDTSDFLIYDRAILGGYLDIIKYFIECANANVNVDNGIGRTMLIFAVTNNQLEIVKYLMDKGADATIQDQFISKTACELAKGKSNEAAMLAAMNNCTAAPTPPTPSTFSCAP